MPMFTGFRKPSRLHSVWPGALVVLFVLAFGLFGFNILTTQADPAVRVLGQPDLVSGGADRANRNGQGFYSPLDVAVDSTGGIYVAEGEFGTSPNSNNRVLYFANDTPNGPDGTADRVYGQDNLFSRALGTSATRFYEPVALALDSDDTLYVSDYINDRVVVFNDDGDTIADDVFGQPNLTSSTCNNGGRSAQSLCGPQGLAIDASGLYVADTGNNRVLFYARSAGVIDNIADRVYGQLNSFTTGSINIDGVSRNGLYTPNHVAIGNGGVYITDYNNNRVLYYQGFTDTTADLVYGQLGSFTSRTANLGGLTASSLNGPTDIEVDATGVYISDYNNNRVLYYQGFTDTSADQIYGQAGSMTTNVANNDGTGAEGRPSASNLNVPLGILLADGGLYVADRGNHRLLFFPGISTVASKLWGQASFANGGANRFAEDATSLHGPNDVAIDASGGAYVADDDNHRVLYFPAGSDTATRVYGQPDFTSTVLNNNGAGVEGFPSRTNMNEPVGVALDSLGGLYVAERGNHRVLYFANDTADGPDATADRVYGQGSAGNSFDTNLAGTRNTSLNDPRDVEVDSNDNLYVAEEDNHRVLYFANDGDVIADKVFGQPDFTASTLNNGGRSATTLYNPQGLAIGRGGLFVADWNNNRVLFYSDADIAANDTSIPATRVYGQSSFTGGSLSTSRGGLYNPYDVLATDEGVYISDYSNNRVLFYPEDETLPTGIFGQPDFTSGTANNGGISAESLDGPRGLDIAPDGSLYIVEENNHRVLVVEQLRKLVQDAASVATLVYGQPNFEAGGLGRENVDATSLYNPRDIAVDSSGGIYIVDETNSRVLYFANDGASGPDGTADRVYGQPNFLSSGAGTVGPDTLDRPLGVAVDSSDNLFVSDYDDNRVLFYPAGSTTATIAYGQPDLVSSTADNGGVNRASLDGPTGIVVDDDGIGEDGLYIAEYDNNRVLFYAEGTDGTIDPQADRVYGQLGDFTTSTVNKGGISADTLYYPQGIALGNGGLYVADQYNNRVLFYAGTSTTATDVYGQPDFVNSTADNGGQGFGTLNWPLGVAVDASGNLYAADNNNNRMLFFPKTGVADADGVANTATRIYGQPNQVQQSANQDFSTPGVDDSGSASAQNLNGPHYLAAGNGGIYLADRNNNRVLFYAGTSITATVVFGQRDFAENGRNRRIDPPDATTFNTPLGIELDGTGGLYVADHNNNRVLYFPAGSDTATRVFGQPDFRTVSEDTGGITASSLDGPADVALDSAGGLYVADNDNHRVLYYADDGDEIADRVYGQALFFTSNAATSVSGLNLPVCVTLDGAGNLYVTDRANNRVLRFDNDTADGPDTTADKVFGQPDFVSSTADNGGIGATTLDDPIGVAVGNGGIYIVDNDNNRVLFYSDADIAANDTSIPASQVYGQISLNNFTGSGISTNQNRVREPAFIVAATRGSQAGFYVSDYSNNRVLFFAHGNPLALDVFGQPSFTSSSSNYNGTPVGFGSTRRPTATSLTTPEGLALDSAGRLYIADRGNHRVLRVEDPPTDLRLASSSPTELGNTTYLTATLGAGTLVSYTWDLGDGSAPFITNDPQVTKVYSPEGTYTPTVTVSNTLGSLNAATRVLVGDIPIVGLQTASAPLAVVGETAAFTATIAEGTNVSYRWDWGDGTSGTGITTSKTYTTTGTYTVTLTASNNTSTASRTFTIRTEERITGLSLATSSPTIIGNSTALTTSLAGGSNVIFEWNLGDGSALVNTTAPTYAYTYLATGSYTATVTARNALGQVTQTAVVNVNDVPITGLTAAASSPTILGNTTWVTGSVAAGSNLTWGWDFGDGTSATRPLANHVYSSVGTYTVTLTARNNTDIQTRTVVVVVERVPTPTPTLTHTPTPTPTVTSTREPTPTPTATGTPELSATPTATGTPELSATPTATGSRTVTPTPTATRTGTPGAPPIVFQSTRDGNSEIYTMDANGANQTRLTFNNASDNEPAWSPDGSKIAFRSDRAGNSEIYVMDADGSNMTRLTNRSTAIDLRPAWSPDGSRILFESRINEVWDVYVMDADGSNLANLTNNPAQDSAPAWSPDGSKIAFTSNRGGGNLNIYAMDVNGANQTPLTNNAMPEQFPAWSPDGSRILFQSGPSTNTDLAVMDADGSNQTTLASGPANDALPDWSPDGQRILFQSDRAGNWDVYVMDANGSNQTPLTTNAAFDGWADWRGTGPAPSTATPTPSPTSSTTPTPSPSPTPSPTATRVPGVVRVTSMSPAEGNNGQQTDVTIKGYGFEGTPAVQLRSGQGNVSLINVAVNGDDELSAQVPTGQTPDLYDLIVTNPDGKLGVLPSAFSVLTNAPSVEMVRPGRSRSGVANTINIYGNSFASQATVMLGNTQLTRVNRVNGSYIQAIVPEDQQPGRYSVRVTNPGNRSDQFENAYTLLDASDTQDLFAGNYELWVSPEVPRAGQPFEIGVLLHRDGGAGVLENVQVRFTRDAADGTLLGNAPVPVLDPDSVESTSPLNVTIDQPGNYTLYATIDPDNSVDEGTIGETNNLLSREIAVAAPTDDTSVPVVGSIDVNNGTTETSSRIVELTVRANDQPPGAVESVNIVEYTYSAGAQQWVPVAVSGWLPYSTTPTNYTIQLQPEPGMHYLQVRARDDANNISVGNAQYLVNYQPPTDDVLRNQTRVYRQQVAAGEQLQVNLDVVSGDADLYVWSSDETQSARVSNQAQGNEQVVVPAADVVPGIYQIEVFGYSNAEYRLTMRTTPSLAGGANPAPSQDAGKAAPTEPVLPISSVPDTRIGAPSVNIAPTTSGEYRLYLPLLQR